MANSVDPDQLDSSEANWSGSTMFAKSGYIQIQRTRVKKSGHNKCTNTNGSFLSLGRKLHFTFYKKNTLMLHLFMILLLVGV